MSKPKIEEGIGSYDFTWEQEQVKITVSHIKTHNDGRTTAEVFITTTSPGYSPLLERSQLNIVSARSKEALAKRMKSKYPEAEWDGLIEQLCFYTLEKIRSGEPVKEIWTNQDVAPPEYLIFPIMPMRQPTIIFGDPGSAKSQTALLLAICMELPWYDNPLGLVAPKRRHTPLLLDWETDEETVRWQLKCLKEGLGLPDVFINYRRCALPLAEDLDQIQRHANETESDVLIIDSLGPACGGDLKEAANAIAFNQALRQLKRTPLILAHTSKDRENRHKTVFGSTFFEALARSIWEIRKVQEHGDDEIDVGLFHRKANMSKLHHPLGFKFQFREDEIIVTKQDTRTVAQFLEHMSIPTRILEALKEGPMTYDELEEILGEKRDSIRQACGRLEEKGKIVKIEDQWGLVYDGA